MKRQVRQGVACLLVLALAAMTLAGCSGKAGGKETQAPAETEGTAAKTEAAKETAAAETSAQTETEAGTEAAAKGQDGQIVVTDHAGREVTLPAEINRVVVADIYPMASVITVYLGSAEKLVGIHPVCMSAAKNGLLGEIFPEILNADTSFMTGSDLNVEQLLNLDPDVVFCSAGNSELMSALENAGIPAVGVSPSKWNYDILETYDQWAALLGQMFPESDKSKEISAYSQEVYDMIQDRVKDIAEEDKKDILFLFQYDDQEIVTSGKNFFGQFWCEAVGGRNVAEVVEADNSNAIISMEQIYEWNPELIFVTNFTTVQPDDLYNNAIGGDDWSTIAAVQNKEVYKLPLGSYRSYTPSADTPVTLLWMAQKVYPDLFSDIDIAQEVKDYYQELYGIELTDEQVDRMYNPSTEGAGNTNHI